MIHLFRDRPWTDVDSEKFLADPSSMKLDAARVCDQEVIIANGCKDGTLLGDVVELLQRLGAKKILLKSAYPRVAMLRMVRPRTKEP